MPTTTRGQAVREAISTATAPAQSVLAEPKQRSNLSNHAQLRRDASGYSHSNASQTSLRSLTTDEPPRFVIDLSLPPEQRYLEVCAAFQPQIQGLVPLFDEVVGQTLDRVPRKWLHRICRLLLRGVYDKEENRELKGISQATGVSMYLLVCFNVLLDLFMGCSSGGAAVEDDENESKMLHFRTLDWGMPSLRKVVIQLDFKTQQDGPVIASSITYAGYVGVLTGVRKDFSTSLNFRPNRENKGQFWQDLRYYVHLLMVLLGRRRSISSELRRFLLPKKQKVKSEKTVAWTSMPYADVLREIGGNGEAGKALTTTACYLCFSDGREATVLEKDRASATIRESNEFIVITNNDLGAENETIHDEAAGQSDFMAALAEIVEEGKDRRQCASHNYYHRRAKKAGMQGVDASSRVMDTNDIVELVQRYPTTNETTHFACVMDPKEGVVSWCRRWKRPVTAKWIREHQSDDWNSSYM